MLEIPRLNVLSNREIASAVWPTIFILFAATLPQVRALVVDIVRALIRVRYLLLLVVYQAYLVAWIWVANKVGLWESSLLKDTMIWFVFSGLSLLFAFFQASEDKQFFRRSLLATVEISIFLAFFLNLTSFSLPVELVMQPVVVALTAMVVLASRQKQYAPAKELGEFLLAMIGISLASFTVTKVYSQWEYMDIGQVVRSLALVIWLPIVALPFIYLLALIADYELAFQRMVPPSLGSRAALLLGLKWRVREVHAFAGHWPRLVAAEPTFHLALEKVREFQRYHAQQSTKDQEREDRLLRYAGVGGSDTDGRRLDQREFTETKQALRWIATCQLDWYARRGGRYHPDLLETLRYFLSHGLSKDHGFELKVRRDGQAWYAWRRTVSGWVFAIGAAKKPPDQWVYDGADPPKGYPGTDRSWGNLYSTDASKNWW